MYNFTLPILAAGGAAVKYQLNAEQAFTRVVKVYGDGSPVFNRLSQVELPALNKAFEALSNTFGVSRAEVNNIGADWAAAGASGLALAKDVQLTLQTMILGEMNATDATQALIAIQAQYGQSTEQLAKTIDILNMVENQTGITMEGLIEGFSKTAGVARMAGIDARHLAAMLAALVPAAGSAANAGNALKTMVSRLLSPTNDAKQVLGLMGISVKEASWQSLNGAQRLELLAKAFHGLTQAQKISVASTVASRWQINRFGVLMQDVYNYLTKGADGLSYYGKALTSTQSEVANFRQKQKELNTVLESNPQRLKIMWTILQNAMGDIVAPMIPYIAYLAQKIAGLVQAFANLNPVTQKWVMTGLLVLAAIGPIARYVGALSSLLLILEHSIKLVYLVLFPLRAAFALLVAPIGLATRSLGLFEVVSARLPVVLVSGLAFSIKALGATFAILAELITTSLGAMIVSVPRILAALAPILSVVGGLLLSTWIHVLTAFGPAFAAWRTVMVGAWSKWLTLMTFLLAPAGVAMQRIWRAILDGMALLSVTWRLAMLSIQSFWGYGMVNIVKATGVAMVELWRTFMLVLASITEVGGKNLGLIWKGITGGLQGIIFGFGMAAAGLWRSITLSMAAISEASLFMAVRVQTAFLAIATSPARILGVFRAGMVALVGVMEGGLRGLAVVAVRILPLIFGGPWRLAILAALAVVYQFRNQLAAAWNGIVHGVSGVPSAMARMFAPLGTFFNTLVDAIVRAFYRLPQGVQNAFLAVVRIVEQAAMAVYRLFSYFNPFAHHSPSLVENTTKGMAIVQQQHVATTQTANDLHQQTASHLATFNQQTAALNTPQRQYADQRTAIQKVDPAAIASFDRLIRDLTQLNQLLGQQKNAVDAQQAVVDKWKNALDGANAVLDAQQKKLDGLKNHLQSLQDQYDAAQSKLENYANTPIQGMQAMSDAIFENQMAQKKLQLQIMKWEDVNGSLEDTKNKIAMLAGSIETAQASVGSLRAGGAGSDILAPLNEQIDSMQAQRKKLEQAASTSPVADLQKQLDALQRKGQELDLENSIKFDPLTRQIDQLAHGMKELPFDQIIAGINQQKAKMAELQPQIDAATKAVDAQTAVVDKATAARDALSTQYDIENNKLQALQDNYQKTADSISNVENALRTMGSAAQDALQKQEAAKSAKKAAASASSKLTPGAQNFIDAAKGNFPDVGGKAQIGREGGLSSQALDINKFTADLNKNITGQFGKFDMWAPIKDQWNQFKKWWETHATPVLDPLFSSVRTAWDRMVQSLSKHGTIGEAIGKGFTGLGNFFAPILKTVGGAVQTIGHVFATIFSLFEPDLKRIGKAITDTFGTIWSKVAPQLAAFIPLIGPFIQAVVNAFKVLGIALAPVLVPLLAMLKGLVSILSGALGPLLVTLATALGDLLQVVRGVVEIFIGIFTGNFKTALQGFSDIWSGAFNGARDLFVGFVDTVKGAVMGFVHGIVEFFQWLYDVLVGHSIVPDLIHEIISLFETLAAPIKVALNAVWDGIKWVWDNVGRPVFKFISDEVKAWAAIFSWIWDNIIKPAAKAIWDGIQWSWDHGGSAIFTFIKNEIKGWAVIFSWIWDNIIKPAVKGIWDGVQFIWDHGGSAVWEGIKTAIKTLVTVFSEIWDGKFGIKAIFGAMWDGIQVVWNKVASPIWDGIKTGVKSLVTVFSDIWNGKFGIKAIWDSLWSGIQVVWSKVGSPLWDGIKNTVHTLGEMFNNIINGKLGIKALWSDLWNALGSIWNATGARVFDVIKGAVNGIIDVIDTLINGINGIGHALGIGINIPGIPHLGSSGNTATKAGYNNTYTSPSKLGPLLAAGGPIPGVTVGSGFITNKIRAIVGEGGPHPEYVIPTDPQYRKRAVDLHRQLGNKLGVPMLANGGILDNLWDKAVSAGSAVANGFKSALKGTADIALKPIEAVVRRLLGNIHWSFGKAIAEKVVASLFDFVHHGSAAGKTLTSAPGQGGPSDSVGVPSAPASRNAIVNLAKSMAENFAGWGHGSEWDSMYAQIQLESGWNPTAQNPTSTAYGLGQFLDSTWAGVGISKTSDPATQILGYLRYVKARYGDPIHSWAFERSQSPMWYANGGIFNRPSIIGVGEAGREAVVPLAPLWARLDRIEERQQQTMQASGGGDVTININGNLEFPNISSGGDAQAFVTNLKTLARGR